MQLKIDDRLLNFIEIPLKFSARNISNLFALNNQTTLRKRLDDTKQNNKYSKFKKYCWQHYSETFDSSLGDFLLFLKNRNDPYYQVFLNKYGDNDFCEFSIEKCLDKKGLYCCTINNK